jgi:hypothetical protein
LSMLRKARVQCTHSGIHGTRAEPKLPVLVARAGTPNIASSQARCSNCQVGGVLGVWARKPARMQPEYCQTRVLPERSQEASLSQILLCLIRMIIGHRRDTVWTCPTDPLQPQGLAAPTRSTGPRRVTSAGTFAPDCRHRTLAGLPVLRLCYQVVLYVAHMPQKSHAENE